MILSGLTLLLTSAGPLTADLELRDDAGRHLAYQQVDFTHFLPTQRQRLFDLRNYLDYHVAPEPAAQAVEIAELGVDIAERVLGATIFSYLAGYEQRTLTIQLPPGQPDHSLAALLARLPWEMARPAPDQPTLAECNLLVRVVDRLPDPSAPKVILAGKEALRVLFVFAEAQGSRPLEVRQERRALLELFEQIYPRCRVVAHFLSHGVTRSRLETQLRENGGYHVVHWSGHGGQNLLELAQADGKPDHFTGAQLLNLFRRAGGFLPQLFFLSACQSGDTLAVTDWPAFEALTQGQRPRPTAPATPPPTEPAAIQPGYTSTAHELLRGGVPTVIAMRYAVSDDYARDLTLDFYEALLGYAQPQPVATALATARRLRQDAPPHTYAASDHATPILYGAEQPSLPLPAGPSPALSARSPRLHTATDELPIAGHSHFVGRTWELAGLGVSFIGTHQPARPVAIVTGLGGMGKTALVAEALALWEQQFEYVLIYQAKPPATLSFEQTLRDIHQRLFTQEGVYHRYVSERPGDAIYREATPTFTGEVRLEKLLSNLLRALRHEVMLLVLDNFETNLMPNRGAGMARPLWECQDPAWDRCLRLLASSQPAIRSRVLITCRWPLAALAATPYYAVPLGPLSADEAALYVRGHQGLRELFLNGGPEGQQLVYRLLRASRFHPLLMDRLAQLATGGAAYRPQLEEALQTLESSTDYAQLPRLFSSQRGNPNPAELAYLENALTTSLDQLIREAEPAARRLLWLLALLNEPVRQGLLDKLWRGETPTQPAPISARPLMSLGYLRAVGLVTAQQDGPADDNPTLSCHELVRERILAWMHQHPQDLGDLTETACRRAYAAWLAPEPTEAELQEQQAEQERAEQERLDRNLVESEVLAGDATVSSSSSTAIIGTDTGGTDTSRNNSPKWLWNRKLVVGIGVFLAVTGVSKLLYDARHSQPTTITTAVIDSSSIGTPSDRKQPLTAAAYIDSVYHIYTVSGDSAADYSGGSIATAKDSLMINVRLAQDSALQRLKRREAVSAAKIEPLKPAAAATAPSLSPLAITSFSLKSDALRVGDVRITYSRPPTPADVNGIRVFSSHYFGQALSIPLIQGNQITAMGGHVLGSKHLLADFPPRAGETIQVSLPLPSSKPAAPGKVYQFTLATSKSGSGSFAGSTNIAATEHPEKALLGDLNGDGKLDLLTVLCPPHASNRLHLWLNNGRGVFTSGLFMAMEKCPDDLLLGDIDGDGDLDLLTLNEHPHSVGIRTNNGQGGFSPRRDITASEHPYSMTLGDVDGDGDLDLLTSINNYHIVRLRLNNGQGRFSASQDLAGNEGDNWQVKLGDIDGDGDLDLLTHNSTDKVSIWLNNGWGRFDTLRHTTVDTSLGIIWDFQLGDLDGDGDLDLLVLGSESISVQRNDGYGRFKPVQAVSIELVMNNNEVRLGDLDGDGDLDLLVTAIESCNVNVLYNTGHGIFDRAVTGSRMLFGLEQPMLGDVDGDGDLDLLAMKTEMSSHSIRTMLLRLNQAKSL